MSLIRCLLMLNCLGMVQRAVAGRPTGADVSDAIEKSLPFIQTAGVEWIEQRECVSCHQVPFMVWSLNRAAESGFAVDAEKLREWNNWATDWRNFAAPKNRGDLKEESELANNVDILDQLLLGRGASATEPVWTATFVTSIIAAQQEDGSWKAGGQLPFQKRPKPETDDVTTMWTLYALAVDRPSETWQPLLSNSQTILERTTDATSTEWWAVRLLLDDRLGKIESAERARKMLLSHQHDDGGWGWLLDDESDAFGTGLALYALMKSGHAPDDAVITRAQEFLLRTQQEDGSWPVHGTKEAKRGSVQPTATYWGTCWAVIGLLETLHS